MLRRSAFVVCSGFSILAGPVWAVPAHEGGEKPEAPKIAPASDEGAMAMKGFKFDPGIKVELFAAEPMLANGVAFASDEQGRWYVAETYRQERGVEDNRGHGNWLEDDIAARTVEDRLAMIRKFYPDPKKFAEKFTRYEDRIVRIEDTNGDGKADKSTIFADGFNDPLDGTGAGVLARGNEVWWTCIPHLWRFRDDNGDGVADAKDKLLSGFGVKYAFRGHDMHGLRFGPDGKLYWSIGDRGLHVKTRSGRTVSEPDTGAILRSNPDGSGLEIFATGVRNPQELAFDEFGNLFTGDNNSDGGDQARFTMLVEGGDSGWRMTYQYMNDRGPWNRERLWDAKEALKAKYLIPPIANLGNGPSGLTYNPGAGLSDKYRNRFYLSDFRGGASASVVHEVALEPRGAFFKVKERRDFVKGVLTTDVEFGPDGALYVLDWVESWGGVGKGRIYRFTDMAANAGLQADTKKLISEGMSKRPEPELATLLGHPDMRVRMAAQFELAGRGATSAGVFTKAAQAGPNLFARLHGIWGLTQLAAKGDPQLLAPLAPLLGDGEAEVRAQAAKAFGELRVAPAGDKLVPLLKDGSQRVRFFAAMSLGKIGHGPAFEPLCKMLAENNDADPILRHGGVVGLTGVANAGQLAAKAGDGSVAVRVGALLALRRQKNPEITRYLADADQSVLLEAVRAIHDTPIDGAIPELAKLIGRKGLSDPHILTRVVNANYRLGRAEHAQALTAFASNPAAPEAARRDALEVLAEWAKPGPRDRVLNLWRPLPDRSAADAVAAVTPAIPALLKDGPVSVQQAAAQLASKLGISSAGDALFALVKNSGARSDARVAAMQALVSLKDPRLPELARFAVGEGSAKVRSEGLKILANVDPAAAVKAIGDLVANTGAAVAEKQSAISALTRMKTPEANALLASLVDRLAPGGVAPEVQLDVLDAARRANTDELNGKLKQYEAALPANDPLAPFRVALAGGDVERGRRIFREKAEVQCLRCHKAEIGDSLVGPDLTKIGAQKDRVYLLESIVHPNRQIAEGFQTVVLTLKDGNFVAGRLVKEDAAALQVETMDEQGKPKSVSVPVGNIQSRTSAPSAMPENLRDFLSKSEMRDLVEYLATRK